MIKIKGLLRRKIQERRKKREDIHESVEEKPKKRKRLKRRTSHKKAEVHNKLEEPILSSPLISDLNDQQKRAVVSEDKRLLVLAGAGSGKTKTLTQKILYLIFEKNVRPDKILAITFTKNAANDMIDRLILLADTDGEYGEIMSGKKISFKEKERKRREYVKRCSWIRNITMKTFHSLCYKTMKSHGAREFDNRFRIIQDKYLKDEDIDNKNVAPERQEDVLNKIIREVCSDPEYLLKLKRYIIDQYVDKKRLKLHSMGLKEYEKPYTTLRGENVRSKSERCIADWLYTHGIDYDYEPVLNIKDFDFRPDFYLPEADIYIEHVSNISYSTFDKEEQFRKGGKTLFKTYEKMTHDIKSFYNSLERIVFPRISSKGEKIKSLRVEEEFKSYLDKLSLFMTHVIRFIDKIKVENHDVKVIAKKGLEDKHERVRTFYELAVPLFYKYNKYLVNRSYMDFNDLIKRTIDLFDNHQDVLETFKERYDYILVDEFQDVNSLQVSLLEKILTKNTQLFCVGDDWQSIYGFRGSDVEYIVNFKEHYENSKIIKLGINYRSNDTIVSASNEVIKHNKYKIDKEIESLDKTGRKIYLYCAKNEEVDGVDAVVNKIKQFYQNGYKREDILILHRRTKSYEPYRERFLRDGLNVQAKTIHASKGLEARVVFIIGLTSGLNGFPNVFEDDRIFQLIKPTKYELLMEEERRLFYVALTRAKEELFLVSEQGNESQFIDEIPGEFVDRDNFLILNIRRHIGQKCIRCRHILDKTTKYCPECGKRVKI